MNLLIYDQITSESVERMVALLGSAPDASVTVRINSPGGEFTPALALHNALKAHQGPVTIQVEGLAASAATLICCAAPCQAACNALFMLHKPWIQATGNSDELRENAELLDKFDDSLLAIYSGKTGKPIAELKKILSSGDLWLSAEEAQQFGLVDELIGERPVAACLGDLQPPVRLQAMIGTPPTAALSETPLPLTELVRLCTAANELTLIQPLQTANATRAQAEARLAAARQIRVMAQVTHQGALADQLILEGISPDSAQSLLWANLVAVDQRVGEIDGSPHRRRFVSSPVGYGGFGHNHFQRAAIDALAQRQGVRLPDPHPGAVDLQGTSLLQIAATCLEQKGCTVPHSPARLVYAALTASDFPHLIAASAGRAIQAHFEAVAEDHRRMVSVRKLKDFKEAKSVNVSGFPGLKLKPEAGEITYGSLTDTAESIKLNTYARGLALSREALINDDLGELKRVIQIAANSAARLERDLVFALLIQNPVLSDGKPLFHADHHNLISTADPLTIATLNQARAKMRGQKDVSGGFILTAPQLLVVPSALEGTAEALIGSLSYRPEPGAEMSTPTWVKTLQVLADPRLDEADSDDWYLVSDPNICPALELAVLADQETPVAEQEHHFDTDTLRMKVRYDVGAAAIGHQGVVKTLRTGP